MRMKSRKVWHLIWMCLFVVALFASPALVAGEAMGWRLDGINVYPDENPPLEWSATENILWKTEMPGWGNATPVIHGDKIFVSAEPFKLICLDKKTGRILWTTDNSRDETMTEADIAKREADKVKRVPLEQELRQLEREYGQVRNEQRKDRNNTELREKADKLRDAVNGKKNELAPYLAFAPPPTHGDNGYASPTPVVDGRHVYALFGNGIAACYDLDGNRVWIRHIESPTHAWGHSSSPMLVDGKLLIYILKLRALDPATGEEIWVSTAGEKWGTAYPVKIDDTWIVITGQGDFVSVSDGKVLAGKKFNMNWGTPYVKDGIVYAIDQRTGIALELPDIVSEDLALKEVWKNSGHKDRVYASPLQVDDVIYAVGGHGSKLFWALDAATGEALYEQQLDFNHRQVYASIVHVGGMLLISSESGQCAVIKPGRTFELVRTNDLGDGYRTTPVIEDDRIYIRAKKFMYCIGK